MSSKTNSGLVAYAKEQVGKPYWYGTYGQTASETLYTAKKKQYPKYYTATDYANQYGERVHDCVGLIKGYMWSDDAEGTPSYNAVQDKSAAGMYGVSNTKGKMSTFPGHAGQLLYKGASTGKITHVGVYGGDGYVYEAKGHAYGVTKTKYIEGDWNYWSQCPYIEDDYGVTSDSVKKCTAEVDKAQEFDKTLAGKYKVNTSSGNLMLRSGAGTSKTVLVKMPKGTTVRNYGYYSLVGKVKWLYLAVTLDGVYYEGYASSTYLKKEA